jgi:hypothetical protein
VGNDPINAVDPWGLDYVTADGNDVYWVIEHDGWLYNKDVRRVSIGSLQNGMVTLNETFGGGTASLANLKKAADKFWDRPNPIGFSDIFDPRDITCGMTGSNPAFQDETIADYIDYHLNPHGITRFQADRGAFSDKIGDRIDGLQTGIDAVGVFDPTPVADGTNAVIYLCRGRWSDAGYSTIAMAPFIGDLGKVAKYGSKAAVDEISAAKSAIKKHLNGNDAISNFGVYEITTPVGLEKVGKADLNRVTETTGLPTRVHQQVRQL